MTTQEWIEASFVVAGEEFQVLDEPKTTANITWFVDNFGSAFNNGFTHANLVAIVAETGWTPIFDDWKNRGLIN